MNEEGKATQEVAKATGKAIDAGRELGGFIAKYTGGPLAQAMGIVEDRLKYMRWERQIRLMDRANTFLRDRGLDAPNRNIPLQTAIPLLESASLAENDELQDRWAMLLANAADINSKTEVRRAFVSILDDLTALDALVLEKLYSFGKRLDVSTEIWTKYLPDYVTDEKPEANAITVPAPDVELSLGNLARLGLLSSAVFGGGHANFRCVNRSILGWQFYLAITSPEEVN